MTDRLRLIWAGIVDLWCGWTHGGGHIERDPSGRVNWQCNKCGRWADPVLPTCSDAGAPKDPRGCWNVRCQLGGTCCRATPKDGVKASPVYRCACGYEGAETKPWKGTGICCPKCEGRLYLMPAGVEGRLPWDAQAGCHACGRAVGAPCSEPEGCRNPPAPADEDGVEVCEHCGAIEANGEVHGPRCPTRGVMASDAPSMVEQIRGSTEYVSWFPIQPAVRPCDQPGGCNARNCLGCGETSYGLKGGQGG